MSITFAKDFNAELKDFLEILVKDQKLGDCEISESGANQKGQGYVGQIAYVQVKFRENGEAKCLHLVLKTSPKQKRFRESYPVNVCYCREVHMYQKVLPQFLLFRKKFWSEEKWTPSPKCYYASGEDPNEVLMLENLKELGFEVHSRHLPMNTGQIEMALEELAKFHAISFGMKHHHRELFQELTRHLPDIFSNCLEAFLPPTLTQLEECKGLFDPTSEGFIINALDNLKNNLTDFVKMMFTYTDEYSVLIHADFWCNNIMFNYEENTESKQPKEVRFLDFQASKLGSVIVDLVMFLYMCCPNESIEQNFDYFTDEVYFKALQKQIGEYGMNAEQIYPYSRFRQEWRKFGRFGAIIVYVLCKLCYSDEDEVPDFVEACEGGDITTSYQMKKIRKEDEVKKKMRLVLLDLHKKGAL